MLYRLACTLLFTFAAAKSACAVDLAYYLPAATQYDAAITTPKQFLGFEIGERHLQHHQLVGYLQVLDRQSNRISLKKYAASYGGRPLVVLTITAEANHGRLDEIQAAHRKLADPARSAAVAIKSLPAVIWMGYNVHGNEASAGNAAALVAYHLAAAKGKEIEELLSGVVILLDPCLNPDGFERFAHWANDHRGRVANADPDHREHREPFPGGRTNYYWFDLNRDWLPAQHPESQGRLAVYHRWLPNVVLDFHEMGSDASYFFQPGVPSRTNPLTPARNIELTRKFAEYHARSLDRAGSLYFTEQRFDDFYMGKGSTYPDLQGGVGILFEQGSARGHVQQTTNGLLRFSFAIRNQFLTSLSSLAATSESRADLLAYKRQFFADSLSLARNAKVQAYVFSAGADRTRAAQFLSILRRHGIRVHRLGRDLEQGGVAFKTDTAFVVPAGQPAFRFITSLFETRTEFEENIFYDVTTWTLPLAFNLDLAELQESPADLLGEVVERLGLPVEKVQFADDDYAYLIDWRDYLAPRTLYRLLDADIRVKAARAPFAIEQDGRLKRFDRGTLMVPMGIQTAGRKTIGRLLARIAREERLDITPVKSGLTPEGIDLGSSSFVTIDKPRVLLVVGEGASAYEAGEVWHLLDRRFGMPVTLVDAHRLASVDLADYTTLVMVSGSYSLVNSAAVDGMKRWLRKGGTVIGIGGAVEWLRRNELVEVQIRVREGRGGEGDGGSVSAKPQAAGEESGRRPYSQAGDDAALRSIAGAILQTSLDRTHPLCYGYQRQLLPVFRNRSMFIEPSKNVYSTPAVYTAKPLLSGYASAENQRLAAGSASVLVDGVGAGRVVIFVDNPNFRAFWLGTNRLMLNAVFFGSLVREP